MIHRPLSLLRRAPPARCAARVRAERNRRPSGSAHRSPVVRRGQQTGAKSSE
ncbi:hypothetical protein FHS42_004200 [Streptomyces zagrosensis]|uniref:Uncharacterized protein n=1 Tax=Streptomyces zagrosensis TaxID=1042984 RepID=A0A7W9QBC2_9ACTN|nr:hypothetical protein [Streptomyces zagrosensis]